MNKTNQPNTTPIKDIDELKFVVSLPIEHIDRVKCYTNLMCKNCEQTLQALTTYIDNKILEARLKDWEDYWQFWIDPLNDDIEAEQYIKNRIKELKSNQSKGNDND